MKSRYIGGFTLIEVMIVVVIISILAMIAYPSYKDSVNKTRRSDAKTALMKAAAMEERYFTQENTYWITNMSKLGPSTSDEGFYTLSVANPGGTGCATTIGTKTYYYCYKLTASAIGAQASSDTNCSSLEIDHTGNRTSNGAANDNAGCW